MKKKILLLLILTQYGLNLEAQWSTATLTQPRGYLSATTVGDKVFIAGGCNATDGHNNSGAKSTVDIYNNTTNTWSTASLSSPRLFLSATSVGNKAFFAGGETATSTNYSSIIDIYNNNTNTWSTASLSEAKTELCATSIGSKVFFAGGYAYHYSNLVDIYDNTTNTWSTASLSQPRYGLYAISAGNKVFFAGGISYGTCTSRVDIYDNNTNTWSITSLSIPRLALAVASIGTKVFFAGGCSVPNVYPTIYYNIVDIYDMSSSTWSTATLSEARYHLAATTVGNKVLFAGGKSNNGCSSVVDIYDNNTNTWSTSSLSAARYGLRASTVNTKAIFSGGFNDSGASTAVDIYDNSITPPPTPVPTLSEWWLITLGIALLIIGVVFIRKRRIKSI